MEKTRTNDLRKEAFCVYGFDDTQPLEKHGAEVCEELESVIEPYVTTRNTQTIIEFKGKRCYLAVKPTMSREVFRALLALQFLYRLMAARKAGEIDEAIRLAMAVGIFWDDYCDSRQWGISADEAFEHYVRVTNGYIERGRKTKLLTGQQETILRMAYANNKHRKDWAKATALELKTRHGIKRASERTVRRRLKELGIAANANVVRGQR